MVCTPRSQFISQRGGEFDMVNWIELWKIRLMLLLRGKTGEGVWRRVQTHVYDLLQQGRSENCSIRVRASGGRGRGQAMDGNGDGGGEEGVRDEGFVRVVEGDARARSGRGVEGGARCVRCGRTANCLGTISDKTPRQR